MGRALIGVLAILVLIYLCFWSTAPLFISVVRNYGPIPFEEALNENIPLYYPHPGSNYATLNLIVYYKTYLARITVNTYFTATNSNEVSRLARLKTYRYQTLSGIKMLDKYITTPWAPEGVRVCEVPADASKDDQISGVGYQSCFYWRNGNDENLLYTIWPEDEAENFVKSLAKNEK